MNKCIFKKTETALQRVEVTVVWQRGLLPCRCGWSIAVTCFSSDSCRAMHLALNHLLPDSDQTPPLDVPHPPLHSQPQTDCTPRLPRCYEMEMVHREPWVPRSPTGHPEAVPHLQSAFDEAAPPPKPYTHPSRPQLALQSVSLTAMSLSGSASSHSVITNCYKPEA